MTLEQLRIFVAVAEREHLTRAAGALHLTPSAVSSAVRALEGRYGTPLFHRVGRRIELNEGGRIFLVEAKSTLARAAAAELALSELGGLKRGNLVLQASQTIASYWLPPFLVRFRDTHPTIGLRLTIGNTQTVARAIREGEAELGFIEGGIDEPALAATQIAEDQLIVVGRAGHPLANRISVEVHDLLAARWILREPGSGTRQAFEDDLRQRQIAPSLLNIALELPSNEAVRAAIKSGDCLTVTSEFVAATHIQAGLLAKVGFNLRPRAFRILRHRERYRSRASLTLEEMLAPR